MLDTIWEWYSSGAIVAFLIAFAFTDGEEEPWFEENETVSRIVACILWPITLIVFGVKLLMRLR